MLILNQEQEKQQYVAGPSYVDLEPCLTVHI